MFQFFRYFIDFVTLYMFSINVLDEIGAPNTG